jgi:proteasome accessory factor B
MHPLERLVNLVALLLETRTALSFDEIRNAIPAYQQDDAASAKRMFERDKDTLKEIGIPVELGPTDVWEVEQGYRIPKDRYYVPEVSFTPEEVWALFVAAHTPGQDSGAEAEQAFRKLATDADASILSLISQRPVAPGVDTSGPHLGAIADALARRRTVGFKYRPSSGKAGQRHVDPYGLVFRGGHWYMVGLDRTRQDIRSYRLTRIASAVKEEGAASAPPEDFEPASHVEAGPWGLGRPEVTARVAFSPEVAWWAIDSAPGAKRLEPADEEGWVTAEVPGSRTDAFVSWVLGFGADVRVDGPEGVRQQVERRLRVLASGA